MLLPKYIANISPLWKLNCLFVEILNLVLYRSIQNALSSQNFLTWQLLERIHEWKSI